MAAGTLSRSERPPTVTQRFSARYRHWPFRCIKPRSPLWQLAKPAGVDDVDDDQRAAIVEVEQAELRGGEVPEDPFAGQPPVVESCRCHALHRLEGVACRGGHVLSKLLERVQR